MLDGGSLLFVSICDKLPPSNTSDPNDLHLQHTGLVLFTGLD